MSKATMTTPVAALHTIRPNEVMLGEQRAKLGVNAESLLRLLLGLLEARGGTMSAEISVGDGPWEWTTLTRDTHDSLSFAGRGVPTRGKDGMEFRLRFAA